MKKKVEEKRNKNTRSNRNFVYIMTGEPTQPYRRSERKTIEKGKYNHQPYILSILFLFLAFNRFGCKVRFNLSQWV